MERWTPYEQLASSSDWTKRRQPRRPRRGQRSRPPAPLQPRSRRAEIPVDECHRLRPAERPCSTARSPCGTSSHRRTNRQSATTPPQTGAGMIRLRRGSGTLRGPVPVGASSHHKSGGNARLRSALRHGYSRLARCWRRDRARSASARYRQVLTPGVRNHRPPLGVPGTASPPRVTDAVIEATP